MIFNLFKPKPYNTGYLPDKDGHTVYFQEYGNPKGEPVLFFHGGPGSSGKTKHAAIFNLRKHRVLLFDQRGSGNSLPLGKLENNTTSELVCDAKRLLNHLNIRKTNIYGGSWGSTLALCFAQSHPSLINKMVIAQTFLARKKDIEWISTGSGVFYPDIQNIIRNNVPRDKDMRKYYADLMISGKEADRKNSTYLYGNYERMIGQLNPKFPEQEPTIEHMNAYGIYIHYDSNDFWLEENQIMENIHHIEEIPTLILHNRLDLVCPFEQSWLLHQHLKNSKLVVVPDFGHNSDLLKKTTIKEIAAFL